MQILPKESAAVRLGLVEQLTTFDASKADCDAASHALARLSIFSPEGQIRKAANNVLLKRATPPATEVLLHGLRYPWAAIAENSAEALVQQQRTDLIPQLINMLEEADPRAPVVQEVNGKKVLAVRELVRINHMRNCMLCHRRPCRQLWIRRTSECRSALSRSPPSSADRFRLRDTICKPIRKTAATVPSRIPTF